MKKQNQIACYTMVIGEMFEVVASATAKTLNGEDQIATFATYRERLSRLVKAARYYAEKYFEVTSEKLKEFESTLHGAPPVEVLFDVCGNLMFIASKEMEFLCEACNDDPQQKIMVIEANLQIIEKMIEESEDEVKSVH